MKQPDLNSEFLRILNSLERKKSELIASISELLSIERESAYRRLTGRVQFTIRELGILAREFDISLDDIVKNDSSYTPISMKLGHPLKHESLDNMVGYMEKVLTLLKKSMNDDSRLNMLFDSFPLEFYMLHPNLLKFMMFKWGYHYVGSKEFYDYLQWSIPPNVVNTINELIVHYQQYSRVSYIWDYSVLANLINDIDFFHNIFILTDEDAAEIKQDIHDMLVRLEKNLKGVDVVQRIRPLGELDVYVSTVNIGMTCFSHVSGNDCLCFFRNYFLQSEMFRNCKISQAVDRWFDSLKGVSTLISGGNERERRLFFNNQHRLVNVSEPVMG